MVSFHQLLIVLLVCLLCPGIGRGAERALLVGIDDYPYAQALVGSKNDVASMQRFTVDRLGYPPATIKTLLDGEATRQGILNTLETWLVHDTGPGDRVLFYYSGHGYQIPDTNGDEEDGYDETLVSFDTYRGSHGVYHNMISDDELNDVFNRLDDREVTIIVDSCHSGTVTRGLVADTDRRYRKTLSEDQGPIPDLTRSFASHRKEESLIPASERRVVWSAVAAAQIALVEKDTQTPGGVFTRRFLAGIEHNADRNGNSTVSHAELLDYVQKESADYCQRHSSACTLGLTPTLEINPAYLSRPVLQPNEAMPSVPELASDLLVHDNPVQARLELLPKATFRLGDEMQFRVTSPQAAYLVVLDINARGEVTQLFPNRYSDRAGKGNQILANRPIMIPDVYYGFTLKASEPAGRGKLMAIISEDSVPLEDLLAAHKDLEVISKPDGYLATLAQRLREVWTQDRFNRRLNWSLVEIDYEIVR